MRLRAVGPGEYSLATSPAQLGPGAYDLTVAAYWSEGRSPCALVMGGHLHASLQVTEPLGEVSTRVVLLDKRDGDAW